MIEVQEGGNRDELALAPEEGVFLYAMVKLIKPKVLLEIGTHKGVSTSYIINAIKENGFGHLTTVDPVDYGAQSRVIFEDRKYVDFLTVKGCDVELPEKVDFVFVDGFHTKEDVLPEIEHLMPHLAENAVVVFHDAQNEITNNEEGVNAAIKEFGLKTTWLPSTYCLQVYQHNQFL